MHWLVLKIRKRTLFLLFITFLCVVALCGSFPQYIRTATTERRLPVYSVETTEKLVSLGINCAWGDEDIPQLLALLQENDVRASFFVTGTFCRKFPDAVAEIAAAGHEIGSHSNNHVDLTTLDIEKIREEIRLGNAEIATITGKAPTLFRPPSGAYNNLVIAAIEDEGMIPIHWTCDSIDYKNPTTAQMQSRIMKRLCPGAILLFHAGAKNTPAALPEIITAIKAEGYSFVATGKLIYPPPYTLNHEGRQKGNSNL